MSYKTTFISYSKSFTEKKFPIKKKSTTKSISQKEDYELYNKNQLFIKFYSIIYKNLKKYMTSSRKYHIYIMNSIIFDQRIHKVAVFKNNLLWDESSEFLKRFYKKRESVERLPKISEYYERYTLFSPVYFGLDGLIVIIMNKWTKRKRSYLEYLEDHEDEKEQEKSKKLNFDPLINSSLINNKDNKSSSKSILSKNTLELSKYENECNNKYTTNKNNINDYQNKSIYYRNKNKNKENVNSLSFSDIIDDLSSHYSIIINNTNNINNNKDNKNNNYNSKTLRNIKNKEKQKKFKKEINNTNKKNKKEGRNEINLSKFKEGTFLYNTKSINNNSKLNTNNLTKSQIKNTESPKKSIKISLSKKNTKYVLTNNNQNIIKRNNNNNLPLPSGTKKYQKKIMNTDHYMHKTQDNNGAFSTKNSIKGTIRVNTIANYIIEKSKIINNNTIKNNESSKEEIMNSKKYNYNNLKNNNSTKKSLIFNNKKKFVTTNNGSTINYLDKNSANTNRKIFNPKNLIQIKRKSFIERNNNTNNIINNERALTYRNVNNQEQIYYLYERPSRTNLNSKTKLSNDHLIRMHKENTNDKNIKNYKKNNNKLYLEDPFIYKLTQLTKKKPISLTNTNSLSKISETKNFTHYGINSVIDNMNSNNLVSNFNNNKLNTINYKKNLVLTKLNNKNNFIYDKKNNLLGEYVIRNNSTSLHKNSENSINLNLPYKISNSLSFKPKKINSKNINLNLNLNIQFNIDVENKNKKKKILLNNAIINQMQNKKNKIQKYSNIAQNKEINRQYPLTSRNSKKNLTHLNNTNKIDYNNIFNKY